MARKIAFVPTAVANSVPTIRLEDIPADVRADVEEIYAALKLNPNGRMHAEFDTEAELNAFVTQVTSYCALRSVPVDVSGNSLPVVGEDGAYIANVVGVTMAPAPIRFRKSPTKNLPKTQMDFRVTDLQTPSEKVTDEIRQATAAANGTVGSEPPATAPAKKTAAKAAVK